MFFDLTEQAIDAAVLRRRMLDNEQCGAFTCFVKAGVRPSKTNGQPGWIYFGITALTKHLACKQGEAVIWHKPKQRFAIEDAVCVHRYGRLEVGDMAVWVGVTAGHRDAAFAACRFIIDTIKAEVPIWKQEFYSDGQASAWLANPEGLPSE